MLVDVGLSLIHLDILSQYLAATFFLIYLVHLTFKAKFQFVEDLFYTGSIIFLI